MLKAELCCSHDVIKKVHPAIITFCAVKRTSKLLPHNVLKIKTPNPEALLVQLSIKKLLREKVKLLCT